ncbi:hypothetical protein HDU98_003786 [Podochytrium sp. JEL0797]|nr:hypothetical protein HDU98_003786 [Podochytrium sp. JEL0797]
MAAELPSPSKTEDEFSVAHAVETDFAVAQKVINLIVVVCLFLYVFNPLIIQSIIDHGSMNVDASYIRSITNDSFILSLNGSVTNAGIIDATLDFPGEATVYWTNRPNGGADLMLGTMFLSSVAVFGSNPKSGPMSLNTTFNVVNETNMGLFSIALLQDDSFSWLISSSASVTTMSHTYYGLNLNKVVTINGFGGLKQAVVKSMTPSPGANGALDIAVETDIANPSEITIEMGDVFFSFALGGGTGILESPGLTMIPGLNKINATGAVNYSGGTAGLGNLITAISTASTMEVKGDHVICSSGYVGWLNVGFKSLDLNVAVNLTG